MTRLGRNLKLAGALVAALVLMSVGRSAWAAGEMPVPKVTIYPGDIITQDLLTVRRFSASRLAKRPAYDRHEAIVGKVARRTLLPNQPIPINAIREPDAVKQGNRARVVFKTEGLLITGEAIALQSGSIGDVISLRNPDSGTTIRGTVLADGSVSVGQQ